MSDVWKLKTERLRELEADLNGRDYATDEDAEAATDLLNAIAKELKRRAINAIHYAASRRSSAAYLSQHRERGRG